MLCQMANLLTCMSFSSYNLKNWIGRKCKRATWSVETTSKSVNLMWQWNTRSRQLNNSWVEMKRQDIFLNMEMPVGAFCTAVRFVGHLPIIISFENRQCWRCRRTGITTSCKTCLGRWMDPQSALRSCCRLACSREWELAGCVLQSAVRSLTATPTSPKASVASDFPL